MKNEITIDASGHAPGRLASEIARLLQGKHSAAYERHILNAPKITVINAAKMRFTGKKFRQKIYYRHTGYIGHLKETKLDALFRKDPALVLRRAVAGMLPKNKLRARRLKNLEIRK